MAGVAPAVPAAYKLPCEMTYDELKAFCLSKEPLEALYQDMGPIGKGGFGFVHKGIKRDTGEQVAIKYLKPEHYRADAAGTFEARRAALREPYFLLLKQHKADHPNLLHIYSAHEVVSKDRLGREVDRTLAVVTTLAQGGDLLRHIADWQSHHRVNSSPYTEAHAAEILIILVRAVHGLHKAGILHLDLKPDNILLKHRTPAGSAFDPKDNIVLCDVGLAALKEEALRGPMWKRGTPEYNAPELQYQGICTEAADVWALGVITYILLCGEWPYGHNPPRVDAGPFAPLPTSSPYARQAWGMITPQARNLVQSMLCFDKDKRPSLGDVLKHEWFTVIRDAAPTPLTSTLTGIRALSQAHEFWNKITGVVQAAAAALPLVGALFGKSFTTEQMNKLTEAFKARAGDANAVDLPAFIEVLTAAGVTVSADLGSRVFASFDRDGNGLVDYEELVTGVAAMSKSEHAALDYIFDLFDVDKSGSLETNELSHLVTATGLAKVLARLPSASGSGAALPAMSPSSSPEGGAGGGAGASPAPMSIKAALQRLLADMDANHDGRVSREEFRAAVEKNEVLRDILLKPLKALAEAASAPLPGAGAGAAGGSA